MTDIPLPKFNHPEVHVFYEYDLSIPKKEVAKVLELPRETLIEDMEMMLMDCIERYEYFLKLDSEHWFSFPFHALWVLIELDAKESSPTLLKLLHQKDDLCDYWFGDSLTEDLWETYYHLADDRLEELKEILLAEGEWVLRIIPSTVTAQIAFHQPNRKNEIYNWYHDVLDTFINMDEESEALDPDVISSVMMNLVDLNAVEFLPKIKQLYDKDLISLGFAGDIKEIERHIKTKNHSYKRSLKNSIYDRYEEVMTAWHGYLMKYDEAYREKHTYKPSPIPTTPKTTTAKTYSPKPKTSSFVRKGKKIGRNERCPCGSGKKYKKCCLKKR